MLVHGGMADNITHQHVLQPVRIMWKVLCNAFEGVYGRWQLSQPVG